MSQVEIPLAVNGVDDTASVRCCSYDGNFWESDVGVKMCSCCIKADVTGSQIQQSFAHRLMIHADHCHESNSSCSLWAVC